MKKIMILGGFGFIGLNMIEVLHKKYQLVIVNRNPNTHFIQKYNLKYYAIDVLIDDIQFIFDIEKPNYIINNISIVDATLNLSVFPKMIDANLSILLKIFEASKTLSSLDAVIHLGSMEEYGIPQNINAQKILPPPQKTIVQEEMRENPISPYAICKQLTTNAAMMMYYNFQYPIFVVRPSNLFGKYQPEKKFIPYIVEQLKNNNDLLLSSCTQARDFLSVNEFILYLEKLIINYNKSIGKIINIGAGKSIILRDIVEFTKTYLNSNSKVNYGAFKGNAKETDIFCDTRLYTQITGESINFDFFENYKMYLQ